MSDELVQANFFIEQTAVSVSKICALSICSHKIKKVDIRCVIDLEYMYANVTHLTQGWDQFLTFGCDIFVVYVHCEPPLKTKEVPQ